MSKIKPTITQRIREYYCSEGQNEWLVEKGKIKEGRLLKEACLEIERSHDAYSEMSGTYHKLYYKKLEDEQKVIQPYIDKIWNLDSKIRELNNLFDTLESYQKNVLGSINDARKIINKNN